MTIEMLQSFKVDTQFKPKAKVDFQSNNELKTKNPLSQERFGQVFNNMMANQRQPQSTPSAEVETSEMDVLQATDLKEVLMELGIEFDESLLFVQMDEEAVPMDQLLSSENIADLLAIDLEQLQHLLQQLSVENVDMDNIWVMVQAAPEILHQLKAAFSEGNVSEEDTVDLLKFMKLAQLIGEKTDTVFTQQTQLMTMSEAFKQVLSQILPALQPNATNQQNQTQLAVMQQAVQPVNVEQKIESTSKSSNNAQNESLLQHNQQSNQLNRTVTVTLPTNQASQAEALAKEIANLLNRSQMSNSQGTIKLMLKLFPENLGQIRIEIVQQNGVMSARLLATTQVGKELLDSSLNQLKTTLAAQNIQMDRLDVAQALQETDKNFRDQSLFGNFFKQRNDEEDKDEQLEEEEEQKTFEEFLTEEVQA